MIFCCRRAESVFSYILLILYADGMLFFVCFGSAEDCSYDCGVFVIILFCIVVDAAATGFVRVVVLFR